MNSPVWLTLTLTFTVSEGYRQAWRRYVPEVLPLKPSPDGSPNALMVLRLIEGEKPSVATLPRAERVAVRKKRARKAWNDFFTGLDSALPRD